MSQLLEGATKIPRRDFTVTTVTRTQDPQLTRLGVLRNELGAPGSVRGQTVNVVFVVVVTWRVSVLYVCSHLIGRQRFPSYVKRNNLEFYLISRMNPTLN